MLNHLYYQYHLFTDFFRQGGILMVPLALVSIVMWLMIIERCLFLHRLYQNNMPLKTALQYIRENRRPPTGRHAGAVSLLVSLFIERRSGRRELDRCILDEAVIKINHGLNDGLALIGVLAAIAPLLGLLGTVTGMIGTFDVLSIFGTGNAKAMAGGISEALITTQTGLLIAIPGIYMYNFLSRRVVNLQQRVAAAGLYIRQNIEEKNET